MAVPSAEQGRGADRLGAALAVRDGGWRLRQPASGQLRRCCPRVRPRAGRAAADGCGRGAPGVRDRVDALAQRYLGAAAEPSTQARFQAAQLAGLHLLEEHARGPVQLRAAIALAVLVPTGSTRSRDRGRTVSVVDRLSETTLATELRKDRDLCAELWHAHLPWSWASEAKFRRREWGWRLLGAAVRLDFPTLDLWLCEVRRTGGLARSGSPDSSALARDSSTSCARSVEEHRSGRRTTRCGRSPRTATSSWRSTASARTSTSVRRGWATGSQRSACPVR